MSTWEIVLVVVVGVVLVLGISGFRIANQYERSVVFRLGKFQAVRGPGLFWIIPLIEWTEKVDMRVITASVDKQETITRDNVPIKVSTVIWYSVVDPERA